MVGPRSSSSFHALCVRGNAVLTSLIFIISRSVVSSISFIMALVCVNCVHMYLALCARQSRCFYVYG